LLLYQNLETVASHLQFFTLGNTQFGNDNDELDGHIYPQAVEAVCGGRTIVSHTSPYEGARIALLLTSHNLDSEPITIVVGEDKKKYFVHESHIRSSSEFFDRAMNGDWKEKATRVIDLPEIDPSTFSVYVKWLYSGQFFITGADDLFLYNDDAGNLHDEEWTKWSASYKLGSYLMDGDFRDALIDMAIEKVREQEVYFYNNLHNDIYAYSTQGSNHRKLALDVTLHSWTDSEFRLVAQNAHEVDFLTDLVAALGPKLHIEYTRTWESFSKDIDTCRYHEHTVLGEGKLCYKDRRKFLV
jgi:hypothetical protein